MKELALEWTNDEQTESRSANPNLKTWRTACNKGEEGASRKESVLDEGERDKDGSYKEER